MPPSRICYNHQLLYILRPLDLVAMGEANAHADDEGCRSNKNVGTRTKVFYTGRHEDMKKTATEKVERQKIYDPDARR